MMGGQRRACSPGAGRQEENTLIQTSPRGEERGIERDGGEMEGRWKSSCVQMEKQWSFLLPNQKLALHVSKTVYKP